MNKIQRHADEVIARVMREGGFTGDIRVMNVRSRKDGSVSATVVATYMGGLGTARYRAVIAATGAVRIKRVGEVRVRAA